MNTNNAPLNRLVNPFSLKDSDGYFWVKGNLHAHSNRSDGVPTPQERVDGYVRQGYDFLAMTDHHKITPVAKLKRPDDFVLIQGAELHPDNPFGGQMHHLLAYNLVENIPARELPPQRVIDEVRAQGGSIWLAHPHWSSVVIPRDTLPLEGLSGVEVFNSTCRHYGRPESGAHWDTWMEMTNRLVPALANDDAHAREDQDHDTYGGWTWARVRERSPKAIIEALERGQGYASCGPVVHDLQVTYGEKAWRHWKGREEAGYAIRIRTSPVRRILAIADQYGNCYHEHGEPFTEAVIAVHHRRKWARLEVIGLDGGKAWTNPIDLTAFRP